MSMIEIRDDKLMVDADAPDPLPRLARWIQQHEPSEEKLKRWAKLLAAIIPAVPSESLELTTAVFSVLVAHLRDYTIGLIKYATARAELQMSVSATATVRR